MFDDNKDEISLDSAAENAGGYVDYVPGRLLVIEADYRALSNYRRKKGVRPSDITEDEYSVFLYDEPLVYT